MGWCQAFPRTNTIFFLRNSYSIDIILLRKGKDKTDMSELGERFAREEMEREMRDEELAEALGLEGKALEDFWRRRRE